MVTQQREGKKTDKMSMASSYTFSFFVFVEHAYNAIMDEVISGNDRGELRALFEKLDEIGDIDYRKLLKTQDASEFSYYLYSAVIDVLFNESPAIDS